MLEPINFCAGETSGVGKVCVEKRGFFSRICCDNEKRSASLKSNKFHLFSFHSTSPSALFAGLLP